MNRTAYSELKGKKLCLRCGHLNNGSLDMMKKICLCATPILAPAEEITIYPMHELRRKYDFKEESS